MTKRNPPPMERPLCMEMGNGVWPASKKMPLAPVPASDGDLPPEKSDGPIMTCGGIEVEYRAGDMSTSEDWQEFLDAPAGKGDLPGGG